MTAAPDPYAILDVPRDADAAAIRKAYFRLVRVHTPEDDPERFREITEAYEILSDPGRRAEFDVQESIPDAARRTLDRAHELLAKLPAKAAKLARPLAADTSQPDLVRFAAASILTEADDLDAATPVLTDLVERNPTHVGYVCTLVRCLRAAQQFGTARRHLIRALEAHPGEGVLYAALAQVYMAAGKFDRAEQVLRAALPRFEGSPGDSIPLRFQLVFVFAHEESWDDLEATITAIDRSAPESDGDLRYHVLTRWIDIGEQFEGVGALQAAARCFEEANRLHPTDRLREHLHELRRRQAGQDEARGALDDGRVPDWIKALIVVGFRGAPNEEEADRLFGIVVARNLADRRTARQEWDRFARKYPLAAAALEGVLDHAVERSGHVKEQLGRGQRKRASGHDFSTARVVGTVALLLAALALISMFRERKKRHRPPPRTPVEEILERARERGGKSGMDWIYAARVEELLAENPAMSHDEALAQAKAEGAIDIPVPDFEPVTTEETR